MAVLNLTTAKSFRQYSAVEGKNHPPIHPLWQHDPPTGDAVAPTDSPAFTAVAATNLITSVGHGLIVNTPIRVASTTTLPGGLAAATTYYVIASGLTADDFKVSATLAGTEIDITSTGTGTHTWTRYLTLGEQNEVNAWLILASPTAPALGFAYRTAAAKDAYASLSVNAKITAAAYIAYWTNPAHLAWVIDDYLERHHQWIWRSADHQDAAQAAIPPSSVDTGIGSGAPASSANTSPN